MIVPFSIRPQSQNKVARYVFFACLGSVLLLLVLNSMIGKYRGLLGLVILVFLTAAIYVYNRYMSAIYTYEVTFDGNNEPVFIISQLIGKRRSTLCRVGIASIVSVDIIDKAKRREYKVDRTVARYSYYPTMMPDKLCLIKVRSAYDKADVFVELSEEHASLLMRYAAIAKENSPEESDEY